MKDLRILYMPAHGVLEYDELRLFSALGCRIFSPGYYLDPVAPISNIRPALQGVLPVQDAREIWDRAGLTVDTCLMNDDFVNLFDVVIVIHRFLLLSQMATRLRPLCVFRTIGQSIPELEVQLKTIRSNIKIVRYSPNEIKIPDFAGCDAVIRFAKFEEDFKIYRGSKKQILSFYQNASRRPAFCSYDFFELSTKPFSRVLYGNGNPISSFSKPAVSYENMLSLYADHAVYFSLGTYPASYTLNLIEAMMTGVPVVALGRKAFASTAVKGAVEMSPAYEVPDILVDAPGPMIVNNVIEARRSLDIFLSDDNLAVAAGAWLKQKGRQLFSSETALHEWSSFLTTHA